jgi:hypothetical protein
MIRVRQAADLGGWVQWARLFASLALALALCSMSTLVGQTAGLAVTVTGGPIILAGHDADDHGFESIYAGLFNSLRSQATNGGTGILALGADEASRAGTWIKTVASLMATPQTVTFVNNAAISTQSFTGYSILFVPSDDHDTPGGITASENSLLTARAGDVAAFVNSGGGLFGLTQGELTNPFGYLGSVGAFTTVSAPPSGQLPSGGLFDNVAPTAEGLLLGIAESNIDGCCWHNVFTAYPSFLKVLATADEAADASFHGKAAVLGGARVIVVPDVRGRMTGGGGVLTSVGELVTHGFELRCNPSDNVSNLQVNWGRGNSFHLERLTAASCSDDPTLQPNPPAAGFDTYRGAGTGRLNGAPGAKVEWVFTDEGEPGTKDGLQLVIRDASNNVVLQVSGRLSRGNHQAHK